MKLVFYNHFHNGDIFTSREFVKQVKSELKDIEIFYAHGNSPKITLDVAPHMDLNPMVLPNYRFTYVDKDLYINTWIGAYSEAQDRSPPHFYDVGIDYVSLTNMWSFIFDAINSILGTSLQIKHRDEYIPQIDYSVFDCTNVDEFLSKHKDIVMISNGPPMSGQSFDSTLEREINTLANTFKNLTFVYTHKIAAKQDNMFYSGDITKTDKDLMELSYLSRKATLIIGKNSGPYIYSTVRENMMDKKKTFLQFNLEERDSLFYAMPYKCKYTYIAPYLWDEAFHYIINHIHKAFQ